MSEQPATPGFQTKTILSRLLAQAGLSPRKRHGQHFLIDRNLMRKLVGAAELDRADTVLEVGAGTGSLTAMLAAGARTVVSVEIDEPLAAVAAEHLAACPNIRLIRADALKNKSAIDPRVEAALREAAPVRQGALKLVANLPYDIATPLIVCLLLGEQRFARLCFTVQTEVADRLLAGPGGAEYGPASVITQLLAEGRVVCRVPPQAFWPVPKVHSTMLRLDVRPVGSLPIDDPRRFAALVRSFFLYRRKTIGHIARNLENADAAVAAIGKSGLDPAMRPEALSVAQWIAFYKSVG